MSYKYSRIAITSDVDWAHDEVIDYLISILDRYGIKITLFCTHKINLESIKKHELAIHPNFTKEKTDEQTIKELMEIYPDAKGTRSHGLQFNSKTLEIYGELGLEYDSNYYMPGQLINPYVIYKGIVELPIFFSDDAPVADPNSFTIANFDLPEQGLKIFNFHPIHVFLNTKTNSEYTRAKQYLQNPGELKKYRNKGKGTKDTLIELLDFIKRNDIKCHTLKEVSDEFRKDMA